MKNKETSKIRNSGYCLLDDGPGKNDFNDDYEIK